MTDKRYSFNWERGHPNFWDNYCDLADCYLTCEDVVNRLNELNEEKEWLEINNKDLVSFIKSKGYTLKDFLEYLGQFRSVGVNKEDWND